MSYTAGDWLRDFFTKSPGYAFRASADAARMNEGALDAASKPKSKPASQNYLPGAWENGPPGGGIQTSSIPADAGPTGIQGPTFDQMNPWSAKTNFSGYGMTGSLPAINGGETGISPFGGVNFMQGALQPANDLYKSVYTPFLTGAFRR